MSVERLRAFIASQDDTPQQDAAWDSLNKLEADLAAARALLRSAAELLDEVQSYTSHAAHSPSMTRDCAAAVASIRAALAGKDAT
jgi:multidrug resistance efflux pump